MGFEYLMRHQDAWKKSGLMWPHQAVKRVLLFVLYTHFVGMPLKDVEEIEPPTDLMVYAANRALKDIPQE